MIAAGVGYRYHLAGLFWGSSVEEFSISHTANWLLFDKTKVLQDEKPNDPGTGRVISSSGLLLVGVILPGHKGGG